MARHLFEMFSAEIRTLVPGMYNAESDLGPEDVSKTVSEFIDQLLSMRLGSQPGEWLGGRQQEIAAYLGGNLSSVYDQVNASRGYSPEYLAAGQRAAATAEGGGVHLELGTWKAFPPERVDAIAEHDGLSEFIRLDMDTAYAPDVVADCTRLPFGENSIDRVASISLLEHVAYPHAVIAESFHVLRPGGAMIITAPFHFVLHGCPQDYLRYTPAFLERVCGETGFEGVVCEVEAFGGLYYTLHQASKAAIIREDLEPGERDAMRRLHTAIMLLLASLTPLDSSFVGGGRQFFHSVSCIAFKPGVHEPRGRRRNPERPFLERALDLLACPVCKSDLAQHDYELACTKCGRHFPIQEGIPLFVEPERAE